MELHILVLSVRCAFRRPGLGSYSKWISQHSGHVWVLPGKAPAFHVQTSAINFKACSQARKT